MGIEAQVAREVVAPVIPSEAWPVIYSSGFAGIVCLILLYIVFKILTQHTAAQIQNTHTLETISKNLEKIAETQSEYLKFQSERRQR